MEAQEHRTAVNQKRKMSKHFHLSHITKKKNFNFLITQVQQQRCRVSNHTAIKSSIPCVANTYPAEFSFPAPLKCLDLTGSKSIKGAGYEELEAVGN